MASLITYLTGRQLITPPGAVRDGLQYEIMAGSTLYGMAEDKSDVDVMGWCIPAKDMVFPHMRGEIQGFGRQLKRFEQYQEHRVHDTNKDSTYDLNVYNIVKYFQLCMDNNPNMLETLFAPDTCVLHMTRLGQMVRERRKIFPHKGLWHKYKGYAFSQLHKARGKKPEPGSKRAALRDQYGWDVKFLAHTVRLLLQCEQLLETGELNTLRDREHLKAIRRGEVSQDEVERWFADKEKALERLYETSKLPYSPDQRPIKQLLLQCLEEHYGSLDDCIVNPDAAITALREMNAVMQRHRKLL